MRRRQLSNTSDSDSDDSSDNDRAQRQRQAPRRQRVITSDEEDCFAFDEDSNDSDTAILRRRRNIAAVAAQPTASASVAAAQAGLLLFDSDSEFNDEIPADSPAEASEDSDAEDYIARPKKQRQFVPAPPPHDYTWTNQPPNFRDIEFPIRVPPRVKVNAATMNGDGTPADFLKLLLTDNVRNNSRQTRLCVKSIALVCQRSI
jgi:hypothetical protein